jgi:hypothetical protein
MADLFYGVLVLLLDSPATHQFLLTEIRENFSSYEGITPDKKLMALPYLHASKQLYRAATDKSWYCCGWPIYS